MVRAPKNWEKNNWKKQLEEAARKKGTAAPARFKQTLRSGASGSHACALPMRGAKCGSFVAAELRSKVLRVREINARQWRGDESSLLQGQACGTPSAELVATWPLAAQTNVKRAAALPRLSGSQKKRKIPLGD